MRTSFSARAWVAAAAAAAATAGGSPARAAVDYSGTPLSESFDSLPSASVTGAFSATVGTQSPIPGLISWDGAKIGGTGSTAPNFTADAGTSSSGALYSYGAAGSQERALGSLASGTNVLAFGTEIRNATSSPISGVTISFTAEQWRSSTSATNSLAFAYGVSGGTITSADYLTNAALTLLPALNAPAKPFVTTNGATDGNDPANQTAVSATFPVDVPAGGSLFIRWADANDTGNDAGIAIDNFTFSTGSVPEPVALGLIAPAGLMLLGRRRRRA